MVVEKATHFLSRRWWRTAVVNTLTQAQDSLNEFCQAVAWGHRRPEGTVAELDHAEPLLKLPQCHTRPREP